MMRRLSGVPRTLRLLAGLLGCVLILGTAPTRAAEPPATAASVREILERAKRVGAKGQLPLGWWDVEGRLKQMESAGASSAQWAALDQDARLLLNRAAFIEEMRRQKSGTEALLGRFDQALSEIAALYGVRTDPILTGSALADDLLERLNRQNFRRQVETDSLAVTCRRLSETLGGQAVAQDSLIVALQAEVSSLRKQLWEMELRAGVAEADRSAAETVLTAKQRREEQLAALGRAFGPDEAEILLTPEGAVLLHVYGIRFAVGSAELAGGQAALVDRLAEVVGRFAGAAITVEGHSDNTGSRQANLRLSRRRAETVARLLEGKLGLGEGAVATDGFGPDKPLALNDTPEGRARNRRIDVLIAPE